MTDKQLEAYRTCQLSLDARNRAEAAMMVARINARLTDADVVRVAVAQGISQAAQRDYVDALKVRR